MGGRRLHQNIIWILSFPGSKRPQPATFDTPRNRVYPLSSPMPNNLTKPTNADGGIHLSRVEMLRANSDPLQRSPSWNWRQRCTCHAMLALGKWSPHIILWVSTQHLEGKASWLIPVECRDERLTNHLCSSSDVRLCINRDTKQCEELHRREKRRSHQLVATGDRANNAVCMSYKNHFQSRQKKHNIIQGKTAEDDDPKQQCRGKQTKPKHLGPVHSTNVMQCVERQDN